MKSSFLDYYKLILDKVSFDPELFRKEYHKALKVLETNEVKQLDGWLQTKGLQSKLKMIPPNQKHDMREYSKAF